MNGINVIPVVGVTFAPGYPNNLHMLAGAERSQGAEGLAVVLMRNPANPHDTNAVEVHVPALGAGMAMIGHVSRDNAARLAPLMDQGVTFAATIANVRISPEHPERPGIDIAIRRGDR